MRVLYTAKILIFNKSLKKCSASTHLKTADFDNDTKQGGV